MPAHRLMCLMLMTFLLSSLGCTKSEPATPSSSSKQVPTNEMGKETSTTAVPDQEEPVATNQPSDDSNSSKKSETPAPPKAWSPEQTVELKFSKWAKIQESLSVYKGKVVVIDLWATTCIPCRREFPHLIELQKKYPESVVAISISCDYLGDPDQPAEAYYERAIKFLRDKNANIVNYLLEDPQPEFFSSIELISLPAIYVYDQNGILKQRFDNDREAFGPSGFTYDGQIVPLVESLLKKDG